MPANTQHTQNQPNLLCSPFPLHSKVIELPQTDVIPSRYDLPLQWAVGATRSLRNQKLDGTNLRMNHLNDSCFVYQIVVTVKVWLKEWFVQESDITLEMPMRSRVDLQEIWTFMTSKDLEYNVQAVYITFMILSMYTCIETGTIHTLNWYWFVMLQ